MFLILMMLLSCLIFFFSVKLYFLTSDKEHVNYII